MKINKFEIDGYKSLMDFSINSLAKNNMLYGYNNSGKSNALKALELIFRKKDSDQIQTQSYISGGVVQITNSQQSFFIDGVIENASYIFNFIKNNESIVYTVYTTVTRNELRSVLGNSFTEFESTYLHGNAHPDIAITIKGNILKGGFSTAQLITREVFVNRREIYSNINDRKYFSYLTNNYPASTILPEAYVHVNNILSLYTDSVLLLDNDRYFVKEKEENTPFDKLEPKTFKSWLFKTYVDPELNPQFEILVKFLKEFKITGINPKDSKLKNSEKNSPFNNLRIEFSKTSNELQIVLNSGKQRLPIDSFGTGIQQLLFILSKIYLSKAKVILIEELELNLSPKYQMELLKHLNTYIDAGRIDQLFFTSHSKYFSYISNFSVYEISLDDNGSSVCTKVSSPRKGFFELV